MSIVGSHVGVPGLDGTAQHEEDEGELCADETHHEIPQVVALGVGGGGHAPVRRRSSLRVLAVVGRRAIVVAIAFEEEVGERECHEHAHGHQAAHKQAAHVAIHASAGGEAYRVP